jgi:hypothetical protein
LYLIDRNFNPIEVLRGFPVEVGIWPRVEIVEIISNFDVEDID